jgi:uncharacterized repeat protein (TIGR03803 family)
MTAQRSITLLICMLAFSISAAAPLGFTRLRSFGFPDSSCQYPQGRAMLASDGYLYVTTLYGGAYTEGALLRMRTDGSGLQIIHNFASTTNDGARPMSGVIEGSDGWLYGTTWIGGTNGNGIIFKLQKNGAGYTVLHTFGPENAGQPPRELLELGDGLLYGTTFNGGDYGRGVIYRIAKDGSAFQVIKHFGSEPGDGANPRAGLMRASDGRLYGTTVNGGGSNGGTVFSLLCDGSDYRIIVNFNGGTDGRGPYGNVCESQHGVLYGTTYAGGNNGRGTIFRVNKDGSGYQRLISLGSLPTTPAFPNCTLIQGSDGRFYGMNSTSYQLGGGAIFRFTTNASLGYGFVKQFGANPSDGARPNAGVVQGADGTLYGATEYGGEGGIGAIFRIQPDGSGYLTLLSCQFAGGDGRLAYAPMIRGSDGMLYGTCSYGGNYGLGALFRVGTNGSNYAVIHHFAPGADGANPYSPLVEANDGRLYGTTVYNDGIPNGSGLIFSLNRDGSDYRVLYRFGSVPSDGASPWTGLIEASDGRLYGVTPGGGLYAQGTVFRIDKSGGNYANLFHFTNTTGAAQSPRAELIEGPGGVLYGTTLFGGASNRGTIFKLQKDGSGHEVLYDFAGAGPKAPLYLASDGWFYGTTYSGSEGGEFVFKMNPAGSGFQVLHTFSGLEGSNIYAGVIEGPDGALYGTAQWGGADGGGGTVYRVTRDGAEFSIIRAFTLRGLDGGILPASLTRSGPALYGVSVSGGQFASGTIFKIAPPTSPEIILSTRNTENSSEITLTAPLGPTYRIETAERPGAAALWETVTNITLTTGPQSFFAPWTSAQRYFRAVLE